MTELSSNQRTFINMMKEDEEYERRGFELLLKRPDFKTFFDALAAAGLFDPSRNPGPVEGDKPGFYRVPYWQPLPYLEAVAKRAGERNDTSLAGKVMEVIRQVSTWRNSEGKPQDNYSTWSTFAKIIGLLPTHIVSISDIDLMPIWLTGRFDRSMVGHSIASGTLRKFLSSEDPNDWTKACRILYHCTAIELVDDSSTLGETRKEARTVVDDYSLKEIINSNVDAFGKKVGKHAADIFVARLSEVFAQIKAGREAWLYRPAVESHDQNFDWRGLENRFVEGLRDTLLAWIDSDSTSAVPYIDALLDTGSKIVERIAIYLVDQRFDILRGSVTKAIRPAFFNTGHLHELYHLLKNHFRAFTDDEKSATLAAIQKIPIPDRGEKSERLWRYNQRDWLSAIAGQGYEPADSWFNQLKQDQTLGGLSPHPDFMGYHESRWGFGPTPHSADELVALAESGTIVERLNAFVPSNSWDGPTKRSLADSVVEAVGVKPQAFVEQLPAFLSAKPEYQYAVIAGFKKLWDAWDGKEATADWNGIWPQLVGFFERLLNDDQFWAGEAADEEPLSPTRDWIPPVISEFLRAGTRSDDKAYAPDLLPRALRLIKILLRKSRGETESHEGDALNRAINTSKGKAIEALLDHALRVCRLSDKATKSHTDAWRPLQPIFDAELNTCRNANFEFSALAGAYIVNLYYMDAAWLTDNFKRIFSTDFPATCLSALDGLAFAPATEPIYRQLVDSGVLDWALRRDMKGEHARENLVQRMCLAYLWGRDTLDSPRFAYLFNENRANDLEVAARYFWAVRGEPLTGEQTEMIFRFWDRCVAWSTVTTSEAGSLLSALSLLSCYLTSVSQRELPWLLAVAPHVSRNYNADRLIEELDRLAKDSPAPVVQVLSTLLKTYHPVYDYEDRLKKLITTLAAHPASRSDAIRCLELVRHLPGMVQLYAQLTSAPVRQPNSGG